jgi:hypothetical protein
VEIRGPYGQVFVRGVEIRGPYGQVFVRGVEVRGLGAGMPLVCRET